MYDFERSTLRNTNKLLEEASDDDEFLQILAYANITPLIAKLAREKQREAPHLYEEIERILNRLD